MEAVAFEDAPAEGAFALGASALGATALGGVTVAGTLALAFGLTAMTGAVVAGGEARAEIWLACVVAQEVTPCTASGRTSAPPTLTSPMQRTMTIGTPAGEVLHD